MLYITSSDDVLNEVCVSVCRTVTLIVDHCLVISWMTETTAYC